MSASDPLVQFIRVRQDEDYARQAFGAHNDAEPTWTEAKPGAILLDAAEREDELIPGDSGISRHIVRHDPARVLRRRSSISRKPSSMIGTASRREKAAHADTVSA